MGKSKRGAAQAELRRRAAVRAAMVECAVSGQRDQTRPLAPKTAILELKGWTLTEVECQAINAVIDGQNTVVSGSAKREGGGLTQRYQIEVAALFMAQAMTHIYRYAQANGGRDPDVHAAVTVEVALERAREIWLEDLI